MIESESSSKVFIFLHGHGELDCIFDVREAEDKLWTHNTAFPEEHFLDSSAVVCGDFLHGLKCVVFWAIFHDNNTSSTKFKLCAELRRYWLISVVKVGSDRKCKRWIVVEDVIGGSVVVESCKFP